MRRSLSEGGRSSRRSVFRLSPGILVLLLLSIRPGLLSAQAPGPSSGVQPDDDRVSQVECCQTLLLPIGARLVSLGRAMGARVTPDAVFSNPAGLAGLEERHLVVHTAQLPGITEDAGNQILAATLLVTPRGVGTAGVSYRLVDLGQQACVDDQGITRGSLTLRYHLLLGSFATEMRPGLRAGLNYKVYLERLTQSGTCAGDEVSARTQGIDLGAQYAPSALPHLALGLALTDLGFALQTLNAPQADPMPLRLRAAGSYEVLHHLQADTSVVGWLSAEVALPPPGRGEVALSVGAEASFQETVQLRAGWRSGQGLGTGPSLGLGLHYRNFTVAVARTFTSSPLTGADPPLDVSFGVRF